MSSVSVNFDLMKIAKIVENEIEMVFVGGLVSSPIVLASMADTVILDSLHVDGLKPSEMNGGNHGNGVRKLLKRKRASILENINTDERESRIDGLRHELDGLFRYFKEVSLQKVYLEGNDYCSSNSVIACLLEESDLPFSKLVEEIYEKLKTRDGITLVSVRSTVLFVGQRLMYGIANADADVLEDETESCLWCWETRELKLIPKTLRGVLNVRRICRKKIHERINAVSAMICSLQMPESQLSYRHDTMKALEKLGRVLNEADIRSLVEKMVQKNATDMAEKEVKLKEKELIKELEKNKRECEKEKKRLDRELQKEKLQSVQRSAAVREEAGIVVAVKGMGWRMIRQLRKRNNSTTRHDQSSAQATASDSPNKSSEEMHNAVTFSMDCALSMKDGLETDELRKSHLTSWHQLGHYILTNNSQHWGRRHKPKAILIKELRLTTNKGLFHGDELSLEKIVDGCEETVPDDRSCQSNADTSQCDVQKCNRTRQLLQFDKSHRPAFYGIWPKKSHVVGSRCPYKKDPDLDYDIDSDEEWEEEDPGESLSDCEKDGEEENLEEGSLRTDNEDGSEDGFLVPDGYLSENEGVQVDRMESDFVDDAESLPSCKQDLECEDFRLLFRQQKYLHNLTEQALRKNQPLIISNLMHEKATLLIFEDLSGTPKLEQMCLQALSMQVFPGGPPIEIVTDHETPDKDQEVCHPQSKGGTTAVVAVTVILDSDLPKIVSAIHSCPHSIGKVVESLQQKFPTVSKSQLRNKVRELSEFVDNRWQVKKDILDKLGLSISPGFMENPKVAAGGEGGSSKPLDPPPSYAAILGKAPSLTPSSSIPLKMPSSYKEEPAIFLSEEENSVLTKPHALSLVAKCSYGRPSLDDIKAHMKKSEGLRMGFTVGILDSRHLLFRFSLEDDYLMIWIKVVVYIKGFLFRFFKWTPSFISGVESSIVPIWVCFPNLPLHLFNESALLSIGSIFGKVLKINGATRSISRPSAARISMEIDLRKQNPDRFWLGLGTQG
ncbi:hypothetical protein HHK36_019975 [Tetracentron sinense]|uniref:Chromatin assembly factor 1 subunit FAS1 n=1 Tax=Tetracentron sinense TaxID=13715 RepID=A0A834YSS8_TETSI|nr:hypothetical protein HHK36_019975 [Tetracentron sinense]